LQPGAGRRTLVGMANPAPFTENEDADSAALRQAAVDGMASLDAGRSVSYEDVRRWLLSWGAKDELPPPECR
jgi:predicted transcriptional regulator